MTTINVATTFLAVLLATSQPDAPLVQEDVDQCHEQVPHRRQINECGKMELELADQELNATYQAVIEAHKADEVFIARLRAAQRAWIRFRDAEMEALFPHRDSPHVHYGRIFTFCWPNRLAAITRERTQQLRRWIDGVPEGDVCSGSIPITGTSTETVVSPEDTSG